MRQNMDSRRVWIILERILQRLRIFRNKGIEDRERINKELKISGSCTHRKGFTLIQLR